MKVKENRRRRSAKGLSGGEGPGRSSRNKGRREEQMEDELRARVEAAEQVFHLYCGEVEAKPRSGRRPAIAEAEMTGDVESNEGGNMPAGFWILVIARTFLWFGWVGTIHRELFARKID